jgi:hypothetical protein
VEGPRTFGESTRSVHLETLSVHHHEQLLPASALGDTHQAQETPESHPGFSLAHTDEGAKPTDSAQKAGSYKEPVTVNGQVSEELLVKPGADVGHSSPHRVEKQEQQGSFMHCRTLIKAKHAENVTGPNK